MSKISKISSILLAILLMLAIFSFGTVAQPETKTVILSVYETVNKAYLLAPVDINVPESATALEILVDYSGLAVTQTASGYVSAIGGFTEKQYGGASGWLYYINGKKPGVGLGGCTPTDGDKIELRYEGVSRTQSSAGASSIQGAPASQAGSSAQTSAASSQNTVASTAASAQSATAAAVPSAGESATVGEGSEPQPSSSFLANPPSGNWFSHSALEEAIEKPAEFLAKNPGNWTASALQAAGKPIPKTVINQLKKEVKASSPGDLVTDLIRLIINASATRRINVEALLGWMYGSPNMTAQGLNGPVFALLSRSGGSVYADKRVELKGYVLDRQNPDGGFSLLEGWESDPDMTALVLTALCESEHDSTRLRERTQTVAGRAFDWLSANQNADGSFGAPPSAESSATAIMALKSWGILPDDVRFVKNGRTALDGLMGFYNGEGFMHVLGAETDTIATEQALLALCDGGFGQPFGVAVHSGKSGIQDYAPHFFIAGFTLILLAISGVLVYKKIKRKKSENQT